MLKIHVISVGGSIIAPASGIDIKFLKQFKTVIDKYTRKGHKFLIVCGGGDTARNYIEAAKKIGGLTRDDLDWLGIHATRLNAHLMRTIFRNSAYHQVLKNPARRTAKWNQPVVIAAGWRPGWSTDYVATRFAKRLKASEVINLSNVKYVYDSDPRKNKNAKPLKEISWKNFRKIVGNKWDPGLNLPFDPVASRLADQAGIRVVMASGKDIKNLEKILSGKPFVGTVIE
jgi:uridylate kinase